MDYHYQARLTGGRREELTKRVLEDGLSGAGGIVSMARLGLEIAVHVRVDRRAARRGRSLWRLSGCGANAGQACESLSI